MVANVPQDRDRAAGAVGRGPDLPAFTTDGKGLHPGAVLASRNYRLFFSATLSASLGDWAGLFALQILVTSLSQGTQVALFSLGAIMMARLVPSLFVSPVAGVLADRYDRKRLMVFCHIARGILFVGLAFSDDLIALLALTFIIECLSLAFVAAKDATLPELVHPGQIEEANQLNLLVTYAPLPLGALLPAIVTGLTAGGVRITLIVSGLTFVISAGLMSRMHLPARARKRPRGEESVGFLEELRAGLSFIRERPLIRSLIVGVAGVFFGAGVVVNLGPVFVADELGRPASDWGWLAAAVGLGVAVGIASVRLATTRFEKAKLFPWGLATTGGIAAVIAVLPTFLLTVIAGFLMGVAVGFSFVIGYTLIHESTPDEVRARTFAAFYTATRIALFASLGLAPFLAATIGTVAVFAGGESVALSGVRVSIMLGGLFGLVVAASAGRGMYRAVRRDEAKTTVRLPGKDLPAGAGVFVAFEGIEGSGKSTQVQLLAAKLRAEGHEVVVTREPGGPPVAERVRDVLLDPSLRGMHERTEALLYAAARTEHLHRVVLPALTAGKIVLTDRFLDSSLAYQGYGRGLGADDVLEINRWAVEGVLPHAVVLLELDPEEGLARVARRDPGRLDRIESEEMDFHRRVAHGYTDLVRRDGGRFVVVDAGRDPEDLARAIRRRLEPWIPYREAPTPRDRAAHGSRGNAG